MKKQVPITVVSETFLNQTAPISETVLYTSEAGGLYLVACCQELFDPVNDNASAFLKFQGQQAGGPPEILLNGAPGWQNAEIILVQPGGNISLFTNNVNINPGGYYNIYIAILEL